MDWRVVDWGEIADYWDEKQGDEGDLWHRALIDPAVFRVIGEVAGRRVMDLACGNGYLARRLARMGAQVVGVDRSASIIARARERERREPLGVAYAVADATSLRGVEGDSFDMVLCNMALMDMPDAEGALREAARVLRSGGRLVASLSHPCFDTGGGSGWVIERTGPEISISRKVARYREPFEDLVPWRAGFYTRSYHRPLSWYVRALWAAGLALTGFEEPAPTQEFMEKDDEGAMIARVPLHCVFEARKLG